MLVVINFDPAEDVVVGLRFDLLKEPEMAASVVAKGEFCHVGPCFALDVHSIFEVNAREVLSFAAVAELGCP